MWAKRALPRESQPIIFFFFFRLPLTLRGVGFSHPFILTFYSCRLLSLPFFLFLFSSLTFIISYRHCLLRFIYFFKKDEALPALYFVRLSHFLIHMQGVWLDYWKLKYYRRMNYLTLCFSSALAWTQVFGNAADTRCTFPDAGHRGNSDA